jgi:4-alpha-glucanotransferase
VTHPSLQLRQLAQAYDVATDFWDWQGRYCEVTEETIVAVLRALGVDASTDASIATALHEHHMSRWHQTLPPCVVTRQGWTTGFWVHVTHGDPVDVWIDFETGGSRGGLRQLDNFEPPREVGDRLVGEASFELPPDLPLGYHTLRMRSGARRASASLIVTPRWLGFPEQMGTRRTWGLAAQLYSVRSQRSWGVGDLADLADLAVWSAAEHDAGFVLVNPLHAAEPTLPMEPSPYLPTTRRFANPIYLRVEQIPEFAYLSEGDRLAVSALRVELDAALQGLDRVDRDTSWAAKQAALRIVHAVPRSAGRDLAYEAFRRREGVGLEDFATWCTIAQQHGSDWHEWPEELRHPANPQVDAYRAGHADEVDFHRWLQWVLEEQLAGTQASAVRAGMVLGIMHDLAVGVHPDGSDAWGLQDVLAQGINVGAPPDPYNQMGQDWSQPPWRPDQLAAQAYEPFRALVSASLRHAGGLRVDHVIGLFRLWWIPEGEPPTAGTYVRYDHEALIGILALEAYRSRALVVGEDLGTVEPWVRDYLRERGILGTSILWFEFDEQGQPLRPEAWREYCLASVTTHDLPPTAGYLAGDHVRIRESLDLLTRPLEEELEADATDRGAWLHELAERGALAPNATVEETIQALHRFLTWTPSRLLLVSLVDAVGDRRMQNQPGTTDEYPNWRVPLTDADGKPLQLEDVFQMRRAAELCEVVRPG